MALEARIVDAGDPVVTLEEASDRHRVLLVVFHPCRQRLGASRDEVAVERRERVSKSDPLRKRQFLEDLVVVGDDGTAGRVGVSVEVLGGAVHDDVGTQFERSLEVGAREGAVDPERDAVVVGDVGY
jgi:hypothetical protein